MISYHYSIKKFFLIYQIFKYYIFEGLSLTKQLFIKDMHIHIKMFVVRKI